MSQYPEQDRYAAVLHILSRSGLALTILCFLLYCSGIFPVFVSLAKTKQYLTLSLSEFVSISGLPLGWDCFKFLSFGEIIGNLGLLYLSASTLVCFAAIIPVFIRNRDVPYLIIALVQLLILALSASGFLTIAGH